MSLKAIIANNYISKRSKQMVFVYTVTGSNSEIEQLKAAQGENMRLDDQGNPLFFVTEFDANGMRRKIKKSLDLQITTNNNVVINDLKDRVAYDELVDQHQALEEAKERAKLNIMRPNATAALPTTKAAAAPKQEISTEKLLEEPVIAGTETLADEGLGNGVKPD